MIEVLIGFLCVVILGLLSDGIEPSLIISDEICRQSRDRALSASAWSEGFWLSESCIVLNVDNYSKMKMYK